MATDIVYESDTYTNVSKAEDNLTLKYLQQCAVQIMHAKWHLQNTNNICSHRVDVASLCLSSDHR